MKYTVHQHAREDLTIEAENFEIGTAHVVFWRRIGGNVINVVALPLSSVDWIEAEGATGQ